jgi:hypothetical protein
MERPGIHIPGIAEEKEGGSKRNGSGSCPATVLEERSGGTKTRRPRSCAREGCDPLGLSRCGNQQNPQKSAFAWMVEKLFHVLSSEVSGSTVSRGLAIPNPLIPE